MDLRDKKVLVTGADGFIGSHLVERLQAEGAKVRAFAIRLAEGLAETITWLRVPAHLARYKAWLYSV